MKVTPMIFNGEMVRAMLREIEKSGSGKRMTRRIVKPQPEYRENESVPGHFGTFFHGWNLDHDCVGPSDYQKHCPYGQPGDLIYVRETFTKTQHGLPVYKADARDADGKYWASVALDKEGVLWTPSIHMPRWASRITLEITDVRVERLQDISEMDARAEGVKPSKRAIGPDEAVSCWWDYLRNEPNYLSSRDSFASLWQSIYGDWDTNPWVWVIEFKPHLVNVDDFMKG